VALQKRLNSWAFNYTNASAGTTSPGTSVTPGASSAEGSWTSIATGSNIAFDCHFMRLWVSGGATAASAKEHLLDIGYDPAGGTSYSAFISDLVCGNSSSPSSGGRWYEFPLYIPAGAQVAARVQGLAATAGTVRIAAWFWGRPSRPDMVRSGRYSETIGTISGSSGVSFTPGTTADGSWQSLGTTTKELWAWQLGVSINNATMSAHGTAVDLAYGDGTNFEMIIDRYNMQMTTSEAITSGLFTAYKAVPAGSTIYVRGNNSAAPVTGYNAVAVGIGGDQI
jgi:hypothetical protein